MKLFFKSLVILLITFSSNGVIAQDLSSKSFKSGEKLTYQASYNMSGMLSTLAQVNMETSTVRTKKRAFLRLKCTARTFKKWDNFFKMRDLYEAYITPHSATPVLYKRDTNENGTIRKEKYIYKGTNIKATYVRGQSGEKKANFSVPAGTRDVVSTIYYLRNLPIAGAKKGDMKEFKIVFDRKIKRVSLKFLGKETKQTVLGKKECYKIAVSLKNDKLLKGNEKNIIWLTADKNKVPVLISFSIPVGSGELKLTGAQNLKY